MSRQGNLRCFRGHRRLAPGATSVVIALLAGCNDESVRDDSGFEGRSIRLDPAVIVGDVEGDPAYLFGDIRSVAVDDEGRVYVGDRIGATVRVYSPSGRFLKQIAQAGQGPGEIDGWAADLSFGLDGKLYVRDASRITVFAPSSTGWIADSLAATWRVPGYRNLLSDRSRVGEDGTYYYPSVGLTRLSEPPRFSYYPLRRGEATGDTIAVPFYPAVAAQRDAMFRIGGGNLRMVQGLSHVPFAPVPSWDMTFAGTVLSSDGRSEYLLETGPAGDTLRRIRVGRAGGSPIPAREREDSLRALEARIDSLPVTLGEVINLGEGVADRRLPEVLPAVLAVHVAMDGSIWIQGWPPEGAADSRLYDVFDTTGVYEARVILQAPLVPDPPAYFGRGRVVGVIRDLETGVERVVVFLVPSATGPAL